MCVYNTLKPPIVHLVFLQLYIELNIKCAECVKPAYCAITTVYLHMVFKQSETKTKYSICMTESLRANAWVMPKIVYPPLVCIVYKYQPGENKL